MKYNYLNLPNFIKAIFKAIISSKKRAFLEYLSFYGNNNKCYINKKRKNFLNAIIRYNNIYKKNNTM